jgi:hypothetical protein
MQNYALYQIIIYAFYHIRLSYLLKFITLPLMDHQESMGEGEAMVACPVVLSYMLDWNM